MPKSFLCDSCRHAETKIVHIFKPRQRGAINVEPYTVLDIWCWKRMCAITKFPRNTTCGYKPRAGRISKKAYQKVL